MYFQRTLCTNTLYNVYKTYKILSFQLLIEKKTYKILFNDTEIS